MDQKYMDEAVKLALENVVKGGKPFGAVIVKDGKIIGGGVNETISDNDPTAHAEILAIRMASQKWGEEILKGATMYASGHPCPMCLAAMHMTHFKEIYYHTSLEDLKDTVLDAKPVYIELSKPFSDQSIPLTKLESSIDENPVKEWFKKTMK